MDWHPSVAGVCVLKAFHFSLLIQSSVTSQAFYNVTVSVLGICSMPSKLSSVSWSYARPACLKVPMKSKYFFFFFFFFFPAWIDDFDDIISDFLSNQILSLKHPIPYIVNRYWSCSLNWSFVHIGALYRG